MRSRIITIIAALLTSFAGFAQDTTEYHMLNYDPEKLKIIPDKVFEFGIALLFLFLLLNMITSILKNKAEHQLKLKIIDKGISEEGLVKIFKESNAMASLQPLKWFLFSLAIGLSLILIHFTKKYLVNQSGYLATSIILIAIATAFFIYYRILAKKLGG